MQRIRSRRWLSPPGLAAVVALGLNVAYVATSLARNPVRFDSAYNLSVSRNLADGLGFASDGLILRSGAAVDYAEVAHRLPFDPSITTGPTVLGPLALAFLGDGSGIWVARALMCLWFVALLAALALIGRRLGGPWGVAAGLLAPLLFDPAMGLVAEPRGPTEVIGEVPAAALLAWAVWAVAKRPYVAATLVGLAVLTKLVAFLAAPAIVIAGAFAVVRRTPLRVAVRMLSMSAVVWAPLLCWQLVIFLSLGAAGFAANLDGQLAMFRTGGSGVDGGSQAAAHVRLLAAAWTYPHLVLLAAVVGVLTLLAVGAVGGRDHLRDALRRLPERPAHLTFLASVGIVVPWLAWFVLLSSRSYPRYAYVPLVLGIAVVLAVVARVVAQPVRRRPVRLLTLPCAAALVALVAWQVSATLGTAAQPGDPTLADQRTAARTLQAASPGQAFGYLDAAAFVSALGFVADMAPVPAADRPDGPVFVPGHALDLVDDYCDRPLLYESGSVVLCDLTEGARALLAGTGR